MNKQDISHMRNYEISEIVSYIKNGQFCQLIGLPGVGREQLFELLRSEKSIRQKHLGEEEKHYHFVMVDFAEVREKPLDDVLKLLFLELSDSLRDRGYEEANEYVRKERDDSLSHPEVTILLQGLKRSVEYLAKEKNLRIIYLFDRFEEYISSVSDTFFVGLSSLRRRSGDTLSVVFALTRPLEHSIEPEYFKDAYDLLAGNRVYMRLFDKASIMYEIGKLEERFSEDFSESVRNVVVHQTGGHRKMTILAFEELGRVSSKEMIRDYQNDTVEKFLLDSLTVRGVSYQIWNSLRPQEQELLKRQVRHVGGRVFETEDEKKRIEYLAEVGVLVPQASVILSEAKDLIEKREYKKDSSHLVQNDSGVDGYHFSIPLFESFVRYRVEHKLDERLQYNVETKRVFIGEQDITDTFTSSEKKALLYLLEHKDSVVSRDDLIQAVWKESVSAEGVSEQALDQLIYRLRRKIEPDFGNPQHLLTVKGIGFRLVF